jgi:hypothetical protein
MKESVWWVKYEIYKTLHQISQSSTKPPKSREAPAYQDATAGGHSCGSPGCGEEPHQKLQVTCGSSQACPHISVFCTNALFHLKILQNSDSFDQKNKQDRMPGSCYIVL